MARHQSLHVLERKIREMQAEVARLKQANKPGMQEVLALLKKHGLGLSDVRAAIEAAKPVAARSPLTGRKVKPKYRNPDDGSQTWTGRGRMPRWMANLVKKGEKPESFLISAPRSNDGQSAPGSGRAKVTPYATPASPRIASACLPEISGVVLGGQGTVSGPDEESGRA